MKFLRDRSFRRLSLYFLAAVVLLFGAEYIILKYKIGRADELQAKIDFTRVAQLESQQLNLQVQRFLSGQKNLTGEITARIDRQNHDLEILKTGGRIDGTEAFLKPLSRLPKITFDNLEESWTKFSKSLTILLSQEPVIDTMIVVQPASSDSLEHAALTTEVKYTNIRYKNAITVFEGQWLTLSSWYNKLLTDLDEEAIDRRASLKSYLTAFTIFNVILLGLLLFLFSRYILQPIKRLTQSISTRTQSQGLPPNELGALGDEANNLLEQLHGATEFITTIGEGKLDAVYKERNNHHATGSNKLAESLVSMQAKLKELSEEEKKRQWANEGLTRFVDILRSTDDNIVKLGDEIIASLVKYTHSNQGALYILNDDDEQNKFLELVSLFAFNTKKFEKQQIKLGEGILGQTFLEKETTLLTEIPEDYVRITSGLGDAGPKAILMVPLKLDQNVYGIVELAAFKEYETHEIAFVEKLGETIASTLGSVKAAQKNKHLIEQFQQQTEEMRAQEEEMRQNMEELTATQEEMGRKERDYIDRIKELESGGGDLGASSKELQQAKDELVSLKQQYKSKIEGLEQQLHAKPTRSDDWAMAEEVERSLKINLEALKITQEELNRKAGKN